MIYIQALGIYFLLCGIVFVTGYLLLIKFTIPKNSGMLERFSDLEVRNMIAKNLMREYSRPEEVVEMLDSANIKRHSDKVVVTYSNNVVDVFYPKSSIELVHSSQI